MAIRRKAGEQRCSPNIGASDIWQAEKPPERATRRPTGLGLQQRRGRQHCGSLKSVHVNEDFRLERYYRIPHCPRADISPEQYRLYRHSEPPPGMIIAPDQHRRRLAEYRPATPLNHDL